MRFSLLSSCLLFLAGCSSVYKDLKPAEGSVAAVRKFKPDFKVALYNTEVNVTTHHLSGLLLIKTMPDSNMRMVFSNEMGVKFFDFEFMRNGGFKVFYIIKQMDQKPVITTLMKDFDLVLMRHMDDSSASMLKDDGHLYYKFPQTKGYNYYITDTKGDSLIRMERSSKRKPVVVAIMKNYKNGIPDTIGIEHKTFKFMIGLKRLER